MDIWNRAAENRTASIAISLGVLVLGVLLITAGAIFGWGWTRLVGAGAISVAATAIGLLVGWSDPVRPRIAQMFSSWSRSIIAVLTLIMVGPLFAGLVMLFAGAIIGAVGADWYLVLLGVLITVFLIAVSIGTVATAVILAFRGLWKSGAQPASEPDGREST